MSLPGMRQIIQRVVQHAAPLPQSFATRYAAAPTCQRLSDRHPRADDARPGLAAGRAQPWRYAGWVRALREHAPQPVHEHEHELQTWLHIRRRGAKL